MRIAVEARYNGVKQQVVSIFPNKSLTSEIELIAVNNQSNHNYANDF